MASKRNFGLAEMCSVAVATPFAVLALLALSIGAGSGASWLAGVERALAGANQEWLRLQARDTTIFVTGAAPDVESRRYGFAEAARSVRAATGGESEGVKLIVDATSVADAPDAPTGPGVPILALDAAPTAQACQTALTDAASAQGFEFAPGEAALDAVHQPLLDALAAGVLACRAYLVVFEVHTDASGPAAANQALSEARAAHIVGRLAEAGAPIASLRAVGHGESRPLVRARTPSADAQNRRVEISVAPLG